MKKLSEALFNEYELMESPNTIMRKKAISAKNAVLTNPHTVAAEKLLPGPKEGVSEEARLRILNQRDDRFMKLIEISRMISDSK